MAHPKSHAAALLVAPDDVEAQFYEALQQADLERLMAVWSDDDDIVCVHPSGGRAFGLAAIRASFEAIFANGPVPVLPERVRRLHSLGSAVHHLVETVSIVTPEGMQTAFAYATNVYVKTAQGWKMVAHHASNGQPGDPGDGGPTDLPSTLH